MPIDVFVIHARGDAKTAMRIVRAVEARAWRCYAATRDGADTAEAADALEHARTVIVLLSAHAYADDGIGRQVDQAADRNAIMGTVTLDHQRAPQRLLLRTHRVARYDAAIGPIDQHMDGIIAFVAGLIAQASRARPKQSEDNEVRSMARTAAAARTPVDALPPTSFEMPPSRQKPELPPATRQLAPYWVAIIATVSIVGAVAFQQWISRTKKEKPEPPQRLSPQMRPAMEEAVRGVLAAVEAACARIDAIDAALRGMVSAPRDGVFDPGDHPDLPAGGPEDAERTGVRIRLLETQEALNILGTPLPPPAPGIESLVQRGAEVSVLMKFRARHHDASEPATAVRLLEKSRARLLKMEKDDAQTLEAARGRAVLALELARRYAQLVHVTGWRMIFPSRDVWSKEIEERVAKLARYGPRPFATMEEALLVQGSLETEAGVSEELVENAGEKDDLGNERPTSGEGPTTAAESRPDDALTGDVSAHDLIVAALAARAKGETETALSHFKRYAELFGSNDPVVGEYAAAAAAFTRGLDFLEVTGGLWIARVDPSSPAAAAGLKKADIVILADEAGVRSFADIQTLVKGCTGKGTIRIEILRPKAEGGYERIALEFKDDLAGIDLLPL